MLTIQPQITRQILFSTAKGLLAKLLRVSRLTSKFSDQEGF